MQYLLLIYNAESNFAAMTEAEGRKDVEELVARKVPIIKIWVDDRRGTYPKMTPEVYNAVIAEAHAHHMLVHAHAIALPDPEIAAERVAERDDQDQDKRT